MKYTKNEKQVAGVGGHCDFHGSSSIEGSIVSAGKALSAQAYGEIAEEEEFPFLKDPLRKDRRKFVSFDEEEHSPVFFPDEVKKQIKLQNYPVKRVACTGRRIIPGRNIIKKQMPAEETSKKTEIRVVSLPKKMSHRQVVNYLAQVAGQM